jgi:hypothetical protein
MYFKLVVLTITGPIQLLFYPDAMQCLFFHRNLHLVIGMQHTCARVFFEGGGQPYQGGGGGGKIWGPQF